VKLCLDYFICYSVQSRIGGFLRSLKIAVTPLAFESFGVRSMCTYVETPNVKILVDAGVSLGQRFRLLPHPKEYRARDECRKRVAEAADKAEVVTISHWHYDHHTPNYVDTVWTGSSVDAAQQIYQDKILLAKDIRRSINFSQRRRGWIFHKFAEKIAKRIEVADGKTFEFGETKLKFSNPVFHGEEDTALGWVLMLTIEHDDENLMYAPDVQGPIFNETLKLILREACGTIAMGGPPLYLMGFRVSEEKMHQSLENLVKITGKVPLMILDHHLLRAEGWEEFSKPVFNAARKAGHKVFTAAEYAGQQNNLLEFKRRELYKTEPPSQEFLKWTKLPREKQRATMPPL